MHWTDIHDIAISLEEKYPDTDILSIRFTDLWKWIQGLEGFEGSPNESSEKVLEAIQMAWLDERD